MDYRASIIALTALMGLGACQADRTDEEVGEPPQDATSAATGEEETVSILRPDVEAEQELAPTLLEPLDVTIGFPEGGDELDEAAITALEGVIGSPQFDLDGPIHVRGHSDSGGSDEANIRASQARAEAVRDWLLENGVNEDRFTIIAFGEQNPAEPNAMDDGSPNEEGRAANRRVEVHVAVPEGSTDEVAG